MSNKWFQKVADWANTQAHQEQCPRNGEHIVYRGTVAVLSFKAVIFSGSTITQPFPTLTENPTILRCLISCGGVSQHGSQN